MIEHIKLGTGPAERSRRLFTLIRHNQVSFGGHKKLKIYGLLSCPSGKQMKDMNRVFFKTETDAVNAGFRPCAHCMPFAYKKWKNRVS